MGHASLNTCLIAAVLAVSQGFCRNAICGPTSHVDAPIKLAVFDFELADFSAGGPLAGESPEETARLKIITEEAKRVATLSGRYAIVDADGAESEQARSHWLRNCNGCEADIAAKLGADQSLLGVMQKLSVLVHTLRFEVRDVRTGKLLWNVQTDLRGDTDESWRRAVRYLMEDRLLASQAQSEQPSQTKKQ